MLNVTNVTKKLGELAAVNDPGFSVAKGRCLELQAPIAQESPPLIAGLNSFEGDISFKDQNIYQVARLITQSELMV